MLRDELGVLPPGDVLKCTLTLARNERKRARFFWRGCRCSSTVNTAAWPVTRAGISCCR
jgi:hypothetical protein